ncbi:MAG TPA: hypothetical protein VJ032_06550 [Thermoanaerobaculia bacterium]|nr:hypothetical protein [Thermoanaerobaculia bacterium]
MIRKSDWDAVEEELMNEERRKLGDPSTAEEMLAYTRGELSPEQEERVREVLVCRPDLAEALTKPFPEDDAQPGDPGYLSEAELDKQWVRLQGKIGSNVVPIRTDYWRNASLALAAALVLALGGLLWLAQARRVDEPRVLSGGQLLMPEGRRGGSTPGPVLSFDGESQLVSVSVIGQQEFPAYRLDIVNSSDRRLWASGVVKPRTDETFGIMLPRKFLKPGEYRIVLYGVDGERSERLNAYGFVVPEQP